MKTIQRLLLIFFLLVVTTACRPSLKEFQPDTDSLFKITFSYPASWNWEPQIPYDEIPPGEEPPPSERIVLQDGGISIQVYKPSNPRAQMQEWLDGYLGAVTNMPHTDKTIQIDGYDARWFTVVYSPLSPTSESYTQEVIYLLTEDRSYIIDFTYFESEKGGRLHKEFRELIKSIKVLP